jgi:hypothetical protein
VVKFIDMKKGCYKDWTGSRFNKLEAVRIGPPVLCKHSGRIEKVTRWWFRCDCGRERLSEVRTARRGMIKDCGKCKDRGWTRHSLYSTWYGIKTRVSNKNQHSYENYGGRGITMFPRWRAVFRDFVSDVEKEIGPKPEGKTLDRVNNDGNYEPGNIRWATQQEQSDNQRPRKIITKFSDEEILREAYRRGLIS